MPWEKAAALADLRARPVVFKSPPKQIAVFLAGEQVFAVDNRCPHEGYPLAQGTVDSQCQLTCNWHNWKFRLSDGECVLGGDDVRSYPARLEGESVWVNTDDPPPAWFEARILKGLRTAFRERDFGRICREITRLHYQRFDPLTAVRKAIEWSHDRFELGATHAYAAAADWLAHGERYQADWERRLVCLAEAVDHMAFDALRHPEYPYPEPGAPFDAAAFTAAMEAEDHHAAEGMIRRGVADGLHWADVESPLAEAAFAHYNDFGHAVIYVYKTGQLVELLGSQVECYLLPALTRNFCYSTREDLLPEFKAYAPALAGLPRQPGDDASPLDATGLFPISTQQALAWVTRQLATHRPEALYDALLEALARNLLHYDMEYQFKIDRPVSDNVGWLDFTHGVTFANAVRRLCGKYPRLWPRGLLQMACFAGRNRRYLDLQLDEAPWFVDDAEAFFAGAHERLLDHGLRDPIFSAHLLKTTQAVEEELPAASESCRRYLLAGLNRFLNSPIKQKHARRLARQAIDLVSLDYR
jgi:nitrite reductase/ring-hydroxylating ferredoxin subunit